MTITKLPRPRQPAPIACVVVVACVRVLSTSGCSQPDDGPPADGASGAASAGNGGAPGDHAGNGGDSSASGSAGSRAAADSGPAAEPDAGPTDDPEPSGGAGSDAASDPPRQYPNGPPGCGLPAAAFCETFDDVTAPGLGEGRAGELDPRRWSGARMQPGLNFGESATPVRPATIPSCRADLPAQVFPDRDALVCDGNDRIQSRHLLMAAAEQSYGQLSLRARQPFDFEGRTGTVVFDAEGEITGFLQGWVSLSITAEPTPAPSFAIEQNFENGAVPRDGVEVHLFELCAADDRIGVAQVNVLRDLVETYYVDDEGGRTPTCVLTERGALNHFELRISRTHLEVWGSDRSLDGVHFGELTQLFALDVELPFERGYVHITTHNHSSLKYSQDMVDAWTARWDNVGFDGPVIVGAREHSIPDALEPVVIDGVDRVNVGYQLGDASEGPRHTLTFHDVDPSDVTSARIVMDGHFNTHTEAAFTDYVLRYRINGGAWIDQRFDDAQLALLSGPPVFNEAGMNTRGDGSGVAGALAMVLAIDEGTLTIGDNTLELVTSGVPNSYRPYAANIDLVLETQ